MGIWYAYRNIAGKGIKPYAGTCPPYYDLEGTDWYDRLCRDIPAIGTATLEMLGGNNVNLRQYYNTILVEEGQWESKALMAWNIWRKMPDGGGAVFNYFKDIPGLVSLSVSVLKPHTHIKPHNGDTDATYRMHIPVVIPQGLPECGLRVAGVDKPWADDKAVVFCDAHLHEAWNNTGQQRVVLIADVMRPEHLGSTRIICAQVMGWLFIQQVLQLKPLAILPEFLKGLIGIITFAFSVPVFMLLQRR